MKELVKALMNQIKNELSIELSNSYDIEDDNYYIYYHDYSLIEDNHFNEVVGKLLVDECWSKGIYNVRVIYDQTASNNYYNIIDSNTSLKYSETFARNKMCCTTKQTIKSKTEYNVDISYTYSKNSKLFNYPKSASNYLEVA